MLAVGLLVVMNACQGEPNAVDADGDGFYAQRDDCDDADATINPDADEICDGSDNDCDGAADESATDAATWYLDSDGDGYGDPDAGTASCWELIYHVDNGQDCDDADATVNPEAEEVPYDGIDNDCFGGDDDDRDGDGYASDLVDGDDCDDEDEQVHPDAEEECDGRDNDCDGEVDEVAVDGIFDDCGGVDDDCDGRVDEDQDADGDGFTTCDDDCDDDDPYIHPEAEEVPGDGIDQNCNGVDRGNCSDDILNTPTLYLDADWHCKHGAHTGMVVSDDVPEDAECDGETATWSGTYWDHDEHDEDPRITVEISFDFDDGCGEFEGEGRWSSVGLTCDDVDGVAWIYSDGGSHCF